MARPDWHANPKPRENTPWLDRYAHLLKRGSLVLDLGCGTGDDAFELASARCRVVALEISLDRLIQVPEHPGIIGRVIGDLEHPLPICDGCVDLVHASLSLHYFTTPTTERIIGDIARVLRDGGVLLCRVNAEGDWNFGYGAGTEVEPNVFRQPEGHLKRFYTPQMLDHFLRPCFSDVIIDRRTIIQNGREKQTLECVCRKRLTI